MPVPVIPVTLVARAGQALYGHPTRWQSALARDLWLSSGSAVRDWIQGRSVCSGATARALVGLLREHGHNGLADEIEAAAMRSLTQDN